MGSETGRMALKTGGSHDRSSKGFTAENCIGEKGDQRQGRQEGGEMGLGSINFWTMHIVNL